MISVSIVSHGQVNLVKDLLADLEKYCANQIEVILTFNLPESLPANPYSFPLQLIQNHTPKGFGANHNTAFLSASGDYFCVLNPDIRLTEDPFPKLIQALHDNTGVVAPLIIDPQGNIQDSAREFLTPYRLLKRVFKKSVMGTAHPDWVAGMFMVFKKETYAALHGFDEKYFLYCEDMDLCRRLRQKNLNVFIDKNVKVIHNAQRDSHKKLKYLWWHVKSLCIYFAKTLCHPTFP